MGIDVVPSSFGTLFPSGVLAVFDENNLGGPNAKLVYAYITYTLLVMMYSASNTPYSALMGVMTPDDKERSSIASYRFVGALVGQFIIQALPLPLVAKFGHGDSAKGWAMTMAIFGALIVVLNLITFALPNMCGVPGVETIGVASRANRIYFGPQWESRR